jgi:hypothetical protein
MEWRHRASPYTKELQLQTSTGKFLASIFWNQDSILLFISQRAKLSKPLVQLKDILKEKCRENFSRCVLILHDNAPPHRTLATQKKLAYLLFHYPDHRF